MAIHCSNLEMCAVVIYLSRRLLSQEVVQALLGTLGLGFRLTTL